MLSYRLPLRRLLQCTVSHAHSALTLSEACMQVRLSKLLADIKTANQKHRNEQLNRTIQNFLYSLLATDNDVAAKKSLAVLTELWRRHVWRDARTVNVIGGSIRVAWWALSYAHTSLSHCCAHVSVH